MKIWIKTLLSIFLTLLTLGGAIFAIASIVPTDNFDFKGIRDIYNVRNLNVTTQTDLYGNTTTNNLTIRGQNLLILNNVDVINDNGTCLIQQGRTSRIEIC